MTEINASQGITQNPSAPQQHVLNRRFHVALAILPAREHTRTRAHSAHAPSHEEAAHPGRPAQPTTRPGNKGCSRSTHRNSHSPAAAAAPSGEGSSAAPWSRRGSNPTPLLQQTRGIPAHSPRGPAAAAGPEPSLGPGPPLAEQPVRWPRSRPCPGCPCGVPMAGTGPGAR